MCPDGKGFEDSLATVATRLRCSPWIDFNDTTTSTQSLVAEHLYEAVPRGVINMFSEMMVTNHPPNIELFNRYEFVSVSDSSTLFMEEIGSLVDDFIMDSCDSDNSFLSVGRTLDFSAQSSLESGKLFFGFNKESGILDNSIDEALSDKALAEMRAHRIYIVIPERIKRKCYADVVNAISFADFFHDHLDPKMQAWRRGNVI